MNWCVQYILREGKKGLFPCPMLEVDSDPHLLQCLLLVTFLFSYSLAIRARLFFFFFWWLTGFRAGWLIGHFPPLMHWSWCIEDHKGLNKLDSSSKIMIRVWFTFVTASSKHVRARIEFKDAYPCTDENREICCRWGRWVFQCKFTVM